MNGDRGTVRGFEALEIWRLAHQLALAVYRATAGFPSEERCGLTLQVRRAAASVGANIAEGYGRHGTQDTIRFLYVARGSLMETRNFILLATDLSYLDGSAATGLLKQGSNLSVKLSNTITALGRPKAVREPVADYHFDDLDNWTTTGPRERSDHTTTGQHEEETDAH